MKNFLKRPTVLEWVVIAILIVGAALYFIPLFDDNTTAARKVQAEWEKRHGAPAP